MRQAQDVLDGEMHFPSHPQPDRDNDLLPLSNETEDHLRIVEGTLLPADASSGHTARGLHLGCGRALHQGLVGAWMVLTLLLVLVLVEDRAPGLLGPLAPLLPVMTPSATVTILPDQSEQSMTIVMAAATRTPGRAHQQIQARLLSVTSPTQTQTVQATGRGHTSAQQAQGILIFYNAATYPQTIAEGTMLTGIDGVQVVTDAPALLPAGNPPLFGIVTVPAHAVAVGPQGNMAALAINGLCCASGVAVKNSAPFSGGQAARDYPVVRQQDIDRVAGPPSAALTRHAQATLEAQMYPNEHLIGPAQCRSTISVDHEAGSEAMQVTVSVSVICRAAVYDERAVQQITTKLLSQQAVRALGTSYALSGIVRTSITQVKAGETAETFVLVVKAEGRWVYQFSEACLHHLATLVAGKSQAEAEAALLQQVGIRSISIVLAEGDKTTFPADPHQIRIVVLSLAQG